MARVTRSENGLFHDGDILLAQFTDVDLVEKMKRASAIIVEEGGLTNHTAVVGVSLGIPVIVGAKDITKLVESGEELSLDIKSGRIYRGRIDIV